MPSFTFTSPEGKDYTVDGPEGATKEQAYGILQQQLSAKSAPIAESTTPKPDASVPADPNASTGGASGMWSDKPAAPKTLGERFQEIGVSGAAGAAIGALAPYAVIGAGMASTAIPVVGPEIAPVLIAAGQRMVAARTAEVAYGAISGLASESAGQVAEAAGASEKTSNLTRLAVGFGAPALGKLAATTVGGVAKAGLGLVHHILGEAESIPQAVRKATSALSSDVIGSKPALAVHDALAQGVAADRQVADNAARMALADAQKKVADMATSDPIAAKRVLGEARDFGDGLREAASKRAQVLDKATSGKLATAAAVHRTADAALTTTVAPVRDVSDIGNDLRGAVVAKQDAETQARAAQYAQTKQLRDAAVAAKEAQGLTVASTSGMRDLQAELERKTLSTAAGRTAANGMAEVTEAGTKSSYQRILDAVKNQRLQVGVDSDGNPKYQTFKTSFEALDQVRRKIGDVAFGNPAEGFDALGQGIAKDLYSKISRIQEEFAGPAQRELQSGYAGASNELEKFGTKAGKKATAVDRMDQDKFANDDASLPATYFKSKQTVQDLTELTGNKGTVVRLAHDHVAEQLSGRSSAQIATWRRSNRDWTREIPGLDSRLDSYAGQVAKAERVSGKLSARVKDLQAERAVVRPNAEKQASRAMEEAIPQANARVASRVEERQQLLKTAGEGAEATKKAALAIPERIDNLLQTKEPSEAVKTLMTSATPAERRVAAGYLANSSKGRDAMVTVVRQHASTLRGQELATGWEEKMRPMLEAMGTPSRTLESLGKDVQRLVKATSPADKVRWREALVRNVAAATGGALAARAYSHS